MPADRGPQADPPGTAPDWSGLDVPDDTTDLRGGPPISEQMLAVLPLVGAWTGHGTLVDLAVDRTVQVGLQTVFAHDGREFLSYEQRSWQVAPMAGASAVPALRESGFWRRGFGQDAVEIALADAEGAIFTMTGVAGDARYEVATDSLGRTPTGRAAWPERRMYAVLRDTLLIVAERRIEDAWLTYLNASLARRR